MATNYGPRIVTDGLIVNLDASQNKSYPISLPVKGGLVMWMDADDDTVFSYDSTFNVTQWRDKSPSGFHMVPKVTGPTRTSVLNSRKVLTFTTAHTIGNSAIDLSSSANTVFVVSRYTSGLNNRVLTADYSVGNNWLLGHWRNSTSGTSYINQYYAEGWVYYQTNTADFSWRIFMGDWSGQSTDLASLYSNGTALVTNRTGASQGPKTLGINYWSSELSACEVAEIIVYNKVLSDVERKQVHTYLGQKWNIANNDKTFFDLSGNGNHAALVNNPRYDENNKGKFYFNKVNTNYCTIPNNTQLSGALNNEFSLCFYLQNTSPASDNLTNYSIFYKANPSTWTANSMWFYKNRIGGGYNYLFADESGNTKATVNFAADNTDGSGGDVVNQYVISHDSSNYYGYKNGSLITSGTLGSTGVLNNSSDIYIGQSNITSAPFLGNLYAFQMYNRALSSSEVSQNYEASKTKYLNSFCEKDLILSWDANNSLSYPGTGTDVFDLSPVGNHCDLYREAAFVDDGELKYFSMNGTGACVRRASQLSQWTPNGGYTTVCVWFRPSGIVGSSKYIFSDNATEHGIYQNNANVVGYFNQNTSAKPITANNWYYACLVGSGTAIGISGPFYNEFYVNAEFISSGVIIQNNNGMADYPYGFGADIYYTGLRAFSGDIASAQLYNRRLTQDEIIANYNATKSVFGL